jgi:hypothetical protein
LDCPQKAKHLTGSLARFVLPEREAPRDGVSISGTWIHCKTGINGFGKGEDAASAVNAVFAQSRLNKGIGSNVTNLIATPYNEDDPDIR